MKTFVEITDINNEMHLVSIFEIVSINKDYVSLKQTYGIGAPIDTLRFIRITEDELYRVKRILDNHYALIK